MSDSLRALMYMFTREPVVTKQELDTTPIPNGYDAVSGDDAGIRPDQRRRPAAGFPKHQNELHSDAYGCVKKKGFKGKTGE